MAFPCSSKHSNNHSKVAQGPKHLILNDSQKHCLQT